MKILVPGPKLISYRTTHTRRGIRTVEVTKTIASIPSPRRGQELRKASVFESAYRRTLSPQYIPALNVKKNVSYSPSGSILDYTHPRPASHKTITYGNGCLRGKVIFIDFWKPRGHRKIILCVKTARNRKAPGDA